MPVGPWRLRADCEIVEFAPPQRVAFTAVSKQVRYEGRFVLDAHDGGTRLTMVGSGRLLGPWRLLEPLLAMDARSGMRRELRRIKEIAEQEARAGDAAIEREARRLVDGGR